MKHEITTAVKGPQQDIYAMYKLRAKVFHDILKWEVEVDTNGWEWDKFDTPQTTYVFAKDGPLLVGSLRLLPTTGPTMLSEVFADTGSVSDPSVWECSRICCEPSSKEIQLRTFMSLSDGVDEFILQHGIKKLIGNFDDKMLKLFQRAGFYVEVIGQTNRFGPTVYLGVFEIFPGLMAAVNERLKWYIETLISASSAGYDSSLAPSQLSLST